MTSARTLMHYNKKNNYWVVIPTTAELSSVSIIRIVILANVRIIGSLFLF